VLRYTASSVGRGLNLKRGPDDGKLERLCCRKLLPRRRGSGAAASGRNAYTGEKCVVLVAVLGSTMYAPVGWVVR
jgi:hypothetical protein